ncbi:uncharacterized protein METZ01_LOCUS202391, partial [marine metagenome]
MVNQGLSTEKDGSGPSGIRTPDQRIMSPLL